MGTLYEITAALIEAERLLDEATTDEEMAAALNQIDSAEMDFEQKAANVIKLISNYEAEEEFIRREAATLQNRARAKANKVANLRKWFALFMAGLKLKKVPTPVGTISWKDGQDRVVCDPEQVAEWSNDFRRAAESAGALRTETKIYTNPLKTLTGWERAPGVTIVKGDPTIQIRK